MLVRYKEIGAITYLPFTSSAFILGFYSILFYTTSEDGELIQMFLYNTSTYFVPHGEAVLTVIYKTV